MLRALQGGLRDGLSEDDDATWFFFSFSLSSFFSFGQGGEAEAEKVGGGQQRLFWSRVTSLLANEVEKSS